MEFDVGDNNSGEYKVKVIWNNKESQNQVI